MRVSRLLGIVLLVATSAVGLSCKVNDYCLNCETGDGGGSGDGDGGLDPDAGDGGTVDPDAGDAGPCVPTGAEICDGLDNDCNGLKDDGVVVAQDCPQAGECAGATKSCVNGEETCSKPAMPESCDNKDNDCDGMVDDGDPGGGQRCGTDLGNCQAGTEHCVNGAVVCQGSVGTPGAVPESCNGEDDDCDGMLDEGMQNLGSCGTSDVGECALGTRRCVGGGIQCIGEQGPTAELCDDKDQDCDGNNTNGYNLNSDPRNCGGCGMVCDLPHAIEGCGGNPPACNVQGCESGWVNQNNMANDGCEYQCSFNGAETCNGRDDDCDRLIDEDLTAPTNLCANLGECATGTTVSCTGVGGWKCNYADPDVSDDANGNIQPETRCDGKDNDCDGITDDNQPNLGQQCDNGGVGACRSTGTFTCNAQNPNGPATCSYTQVGTSPSPEVCDGLDNNCNGTIDDGATNPSSTLPGLEFVTIPGSSVRIMKYEASRPNATGTQLGSTETHVCSRPDVQPWTNITYPQAVQACQRIGARLCTETEWQSMCVAGAASVPGFPLAAPTAAGTPVVIEAEHATRVVNSPYTWILEASPRPGSSNGQNMIADDTSDGITSHDRITLASADNDAPYLHFPMTFAVNSYYVWVRIQAEDTSAAWQPISGSGYNPHLNSEVHVGISATLGATPTDTINAHVDEGASQAEEDRAIAGTWRWMVAGPFAFSAAGQRSVHVFMGEDEVRVDMIAVSLSGTDAPAIDDRTWAYSTNPKVAQPQTCNGDEFDTNTAVAGDQDDILPTASRTTCFANGAGAADVFDMSGNVKEWTAARAPGRNPLRGGSANNEVNGLTCQLNFTLADDRFFFPNVGFRCCK